DRKEELQALARREPLLVAVLGDGSALDQFHDEERSAGVGAAGVQHAGNIGVVHHGQGLPLGREAGQNSLGVHARLDDLHGDGAFYRFGLQGHKHDAHAAFADLFDELVAADGLAGFLSDGTVVGGVGRGRGLQEALGAFTFAKQGGNSLQKIAIGSADLLQVFGASFRRNKSSGSSKDLSFVELLAGHGLRYSHTWTNRYRTMRELTAIPLANSGNFMRKSIHDSIWADPES